MLPRLHHVPQLRVLPFALVLAERVWVSALCLSNGPAEKRVVSCTDKKDPACS